MREINTASAASSPFRGWRMVGLGFLSTNFSIGLTFGSYGILMGGISQEFTAPRWLSAMGLALIVLLIALVSPLLGAALDRGSIRNIMFTGVILLAAGLVTAGMAPNIWVFLLGFGVLGGIGTTLMGPLPATTLGNNWFADRRGMVIGIINIPLFIMLAPILVTLLVGELGWRNTLFCMAAAVTLFLPLVWQVVSRPREIGQEPYREIKGSSEDEEEGEPVAMKSLLVHFHYLVANVCVGLLLAGGIVLVTHAVPYALGRDFSAQEAAILLSVNGGAAMLGAFSFGWLADRIGPAYALLLNAILQAVFWSLLLFNPSYSFLLLLFIAVGVCGGGVFPAFSTLMSVELGRSSLGTALGLSALIILPFNFTAAPLAGYLYDRTGNYLPAFQLHIVLFLVAAVLLFMFLRPRPKKDAAGAQLPQDN